MRTSHDAAQPSSSIGSWNTFPMGLSPACSMFRWNMERRPQLLLRLRRGGRDALHADRLEDDV